MSALQTLLQNRYSLHYKLCYRTGTVSIKYSATEQVQSALKTVLQNRYSLHYKLCYRTGTVSITNCATEQVQSALQTVLQSRYSLHYKLCYRKGTDRITWRSAFCPHVGQGRSATWPEIWCSCSASPGRSATRLHAPAYKTSHLYRDRSENLQSCVDFPNWN